MKNILFGCKFVACLMVLTLIFHWKVLLTFQLILQPDILNGWWMGWIRFTFITYILFFMLNLIAAIGLFAVKKWSFTVSYFAIICSTLAGMSYLPFHNLLFRFVLSQPSSIPMIIINLVLLSYVIYLNISYRNGHGSVFMP